MGLDTEHYWLDITDAEAMPLYAVFVANHNIADAEQVGELLWLRDELKAALAATNESHWHEHLYLLWRELNGCIERMKPL